MALVRVTYYTDSTSVGGAELSLARLVAEVEGVEVDVLGTDAAVTEMVAAGQPGCRRTVTQAVRSKWDLPRIAAHIHVLRGLEPDLLHVNLRTAWSCQYAIAAALLSPGISCVGTLHSILPPGNRRQARLNRLTLSRLDLLVAVSGTAARAIESYVGLDPSRIRVIENGVPKPSAAVSRPQLPGLVAVAVGRLAPEKRLDVIVDALAETPGVSLVLVGDGPERSALERRVAELRLSERVVFTGWQDDPGAWIRGADLFVHASEREAWSLVVAEAMLAGIPVIASDIPAIVELVGRENGEFLNSGDPAAMASALQALAADSERRRELGRRALARAQGRFDLAATARAYESVYRELAS